MLAEMCDTDHRSSSGGFRDENSADGSIMMFTK